MVVTARRTVQTRGQGHTIDVTGLVAEVVAESGIRSGTVTTFVVGSTAAVTTIEFEPGALSDFDGLLETLAPRTADYRHHERWGDDNGSSHVRAALLGPSLTVPVVDRELTLGTWQQIVVVECDTRPRRREIVVQTMGDAG